MHLFKRRLYQEFEREDGEIKLVVDRIIGGEYSYRICLCENGAHIGYCDLRTRHNESMYYFGNIGYRIFPNYRGNNYAYKACLMLFDVAKELDMRYLIITVSPENIASVKTCEKLNGEYIETVNVPSWHPLYSMNERVKRVYRYIV